jgi:hypothetical protein
MPRSVQAPDTHAYDLLSCWRRAHASARKPRPPSIATGTPPSSIARIARSRGQEAGHGIPAPTPFGRGCTGKEPVRRRQDSQEFRRVPCLTQIGRLLAEGAQPAPSWPMRVRGHHRLSRSAVCRGARSAGGSRLMDLWIAAYAFAGRARDAFLPESMSCSRPLGRRDILLTGWGGHSGAVASSGDRTDGRINT